MPYSWYRVGVGNFVSSKEVTPRFGRQDDAAGYVTSRDKRRHRSPPGTRMCDVQIWATGAVDGYHPKQGQKGATGPRPVSGWASSAQNRWLGPQIGLGERFPFGDVVSRFGLKSTCQSWGDVFRRGTYFLKVLREGGI
jgi:hypothetical protein